MKGVSLSRWVIAVMFALLSLISLGVGISMLVQTGNAKSSDVEHSQERQDCARLVGGYLTEVRDTASAADRAANALSRAQARGETVDPAELAHAEQTARDANAAVALLPNVQQVVTDGWTVPAQVLRVVPNLPHSLPACTP